MQQTPPISKVELRISCKKLKDLDILSKSDPRVSVYWKDLKTGGYQLVGKTETIQNQLNPVFNTPVQIEYRFEEIQNLRFDVHDVDKNDEDFIGSTTCTLTSILSKPGSTITMELKTAHGKHAGSITIVAEEIKNSLQTIKFTLIGTKFDKKDLIGKSDPYCIISKQTTTGFVKIYESPVHKNTLNPIFPNIEMKLSEFNGCDLARGIKFEFYDWDRVGKHDFIGEFITTTQELLQPNQTYNVINPKKQEKKSDYKNSGKVTVSDCAIEREYHFLEYIMGGCQMNLIVGIDTTASNGDPSNPNSLHYRHPTMPNQYANAIVSVGNVIVPYATTPLIPLYGFGGIIPSQSEVSHCFPFSLDPSNTLCNGVSGILDCYYSNISKIQLHGPTYLAPLINMAARYASQGQSQQNQKYTILLILCDGEILDVENTIDAIVKSSGLALSIIIVGIGNADFTNMNILDGDDQQLSSGGMKAERDIVQFVAMREYSNKPYELLAAEVLKEIPNQLVSFMKKYKIKPNAPLPPPPQQPIIIATPPEYNTTTPTTSTGINLSKDTPSPTSTTSGINLSKDTPSPPTTTSISLTKDTPNITDITKGVSNVNLEKN